MVVYVLLVSAMYFNTTMETSTGVRLWWGWITGHSILFGGPLVSGCLPPYCFEGVPLPIPTQAGLASDREHKITRFYTAPTAIRALHGSRNTTSRINTIWSSLKVIGSVGEPINEETHVYFCTKTKLVVQKHLWYTWWQTEIGGYCIYNPFPTLRIPSPVLPPIHCRVQPCLVDPCRTRDSWKRARGFVVH